MKTQDTRRKMKFSFKRAIIKIDMWYAGLFWKAERDGSIIELKPIMWMQYLLKAVMFPFELIRFICELVITLTEPTVYEKKIHINTHVWDSLSESDKKKQLRMAKKRLLIS